MASGCATMMISGCRKETNWLASTMYSITIARMNAVATYPMVCENSRAEPSSLIE